MPAESIPFVTGVIIVFVVFAVSLAWVHWNTRAERAAHDVPQLPAE